MGRDKATLPVDGVVMARRVADALSAAGASSVCALGGDVKSLRDSGLAVVADRAPGEGPLAAISHALDAVGDRSSVAVLACDLLGPSASAIETVVRARLAADADLAVPVVGGRPQWLHGVWHRRVSRLLVDLVAAGERSVIGAASGLRVEYVTGIGRDQVADADRPADLPSGSEVTQPLRSGAVDIPAIDIETLADELDRGSPVFDVRQPDEYAEAHAPGVTLVPLDQVPERLDEFPEDQTLYVICKSGGRSARAVEFLRANGRDAVNVAGGTMAWIEAGKPVDTGA